MSTIDEAILSKHVVTERGSSYWKNIPEINNPRDNLCANPYVNKYTRNLISEQKKFEYMCKKKEIPVTGLLNDFLKKSYN